MSFAERNEVPGRILRPFIGPFVARRGFVRCSSGDSRRKLLSSTPFRAARSALAQTSLAAAWTTSSPRCRTLNPNGSGISLGHPVGATGARILATAAHEACRRDARFVLATMCIGGGQGLAAVFETIR